MKKKEKNSLILGTYQIPQYEETVISLIEENALKTPNQVALKYDEQTLTFKDFSEVSEQLADQLKNLGVGPEIKVGIMFPRSMEFIVGMYAVLKAGGAFCPINPLDGMERISHIIKDSGISVLLSFEESFTEEINAFDLSLLHLNLDKGLSTKLLKTKSAMESIEVSSENFAKNLAYIIYTSGTTGKPKGVMIEHRNLYSLMMNQIPKVYESDRILQSLSLAFDGSLNQIFPGLCHGATLILWKDDFSNTLKKERITYTSITPSMAELLDPKDLGSLKKIIVAGEKLTKEVVDVFPKSVEVYNGYGPTEATVATTMTKIVDSEKIHIGDRLKHVDLYVVNKSMEQCKVGEPGELLIGGECVGRGYINREELTKEKFIENPFGKGRLYRSGDLVQWDSDSELSFLGRIDRQIKLRGYRLELDGIESTIAKFPGVLGVFAKVHYNSLVAHVMPENIDGDELKIFLEDKLPPMAIPGRVVTYDKFPLTTSGKIDEKALTDPFLEEKNGELPVTKAQKEMAELWRSIIFGSNKDKQIFLEDNFFDIGGTSIHVLKIVGKLRVVKKHEKIPNELLYSFPNFSSFCQAVEDFCSKKEKSIQIDNNWAQDLVDIIKVLPSILYTEYPNHYKIFLYVAVGLLWPPFFLYYPLELLIIHVFKFRPPNFLVNLIWKKNTEKFYFKNIEIIEDGQIKNNPFGIYCVHPHGATDFHLTPMVNYLRKQKINLRQIVPNQQFYLPLMATQNILSGDLPAKEKSYHWARKKGISILTTPGNFDEYDVSDKSDTMVLTPNQVFFRVAIKSGLPLIPVYVYHQHDLFKFYKNVENLKHKNKFFKFFIDYKIIRGRYGLPIPFKKDLKYVIGKPIPMTQKDNPSWEEVQVLSKAYEKGFRELFEKYRPTNYPDLEIL